MTVFDIDSVDGRITRLGDELVALRRHVHAHPELSHHEFETTKLIAERLSKAGFEVHIRPEGTGLYADLVPPQFDPEVHPTVALRGDIDALPIDEQTGLPFGSTRPGIMHACGHDMHLTCVTGAALGLEALRDSIPGRLRLFYQHAEEVTPGGATEMIDFGAMEGVDAVIGLHVDPELDFGRIGVRRGAFTAAFDEFVFTVRGEGGHGARPQHYSDPIFVAIQLANQLYQAIGRNLDARDPAVLTIGEIQGGFAPNVVPDHVTMRGTVRTVSRESRQAIEPMMRRIADGVCAAWDASYDLSLNRGSPAIINDNWVTRLVARAGEAVLGPDSVYRIPLPSMGSEDFACYLDEAPGAMFRLGVRHGDGPHHLLHSPKFLPAEEAIFIGARVMAHSALMVMEELRERWPFPADEEPSYGKRDGHVA